MPYELMCLPKPEKRILPEFCLLGIFLLACVLVFTPAHRQPPDDSQEDPYVTSWLSKTQASQIMRYHGANAIKITQDRVYIMRDGRWISVYRDPSSLPENDDRGRTPTATARAEPEKL